MRTILLLEDDDAIREVIHLILEEENYNVVSFSTVAEFSSRDENINADLFLLDVMLPDGSGLDVCEQIKSVSNTPVLVMSAHATLKDIESKCVPSNFIQKPFDIENLLRQVKAHVAK
ncbi:response regulator transcription factor [Pedobacter agri]|uniref:response regulator transcription factor n=1 Tax=Pedobacter agri TaxID=454586 RepID=UPI0029315274|nr:response regulator [Pedobacter agri]